MEEDPFEKLICPYLLKKLSAFCDISEIITTFATIRNLSLSEFR